MKKTMKTLTVALLVLALLTGALAMTAAAAEGYSGTPVTPAKINSENYHLYGFTASNWSAYNGYYAITNAEELYGWKNNPNANAVLINDIIVNTGDMVAAGNAGTPPAYTWPSVASVDYVFDGRGHTISGLYIVKGAKYAAFTDLIKGEIKNLVISNTFVDATEAAYNAVIAADEWLSDGISNVKIDSNVKINSSNSFGAFICDTGDITLTNCVSLATIQNNSGRYVGAIAGRAGDEPTFTNCYYTDTGRAGVGNNLYSYDASGMSRVSVASHTCIAMEHPEVVASCYAKGSTAYTDCMICGKVLSGTKSVTDYSHSNFTYTAHATDAEKHVATCTDCGQPFEEAYSFSATGLCICGVQAAATVTTAGNATTYYVDIYAAAAYAASQNNSTMILLANTDLGAGKGLFEDIRNKVNVTLDLNGKILSSENSHTIHWNIQGHQEAHVTLTINDSVGTGKVINRKYNAVTTDTHLVINGGYFEAGLGNNTQAFAVSSSSNGLSYKDTVTINGGTFHSNNGIASGSLSYVVINGGTFTGVTSVIHSAYEGQFVINGGNFPEGITTRIEWSDPIAQLLAHGVFIRNENGAIVTLTETQSKVSGAVTVSKGANLETDGATVTANTSSYPYTNLEHKPTATVVVGGQTLIEGQDYTLSWSNNVNMGTSAVVTATGIGDFSGSAFGTFEITKGSLKVVTNPKTTYEFGSVAGDVVSGGKVVIEGNESAVITGTWAWVEQGQTAVFTPDEQYIDLFNELTNVTVTHVVTPATPVIEVITPSPSIMPGMAIRMSVVVKNPHNAELTDLPTAFRVTYKIGENGTPVTVSGLEFTLPTTGVALGDKVYVTVENVAVDGKYAVAVSTNTIELAVGQVDYTSAINALEEQIAALQEEHNADVSALEAELAALKAAVAALDDTYATDQELADAILAVTNTLNELTDRVATLETTYATKAELEAAVDALEALIAAKADAATVTKAIEDINALIAALNDTYATDTELAAAIQTAVDAARQELTQEVDKFLADAETKLREALDKKADEATVNEALEQLRQAIAAAETAAKAYADSQDEALKATLEAAINEAKATLEAAIAALEARVEKNEDDIAQLQADLEQAIADLKKAIAEGDAANAEALEAAVAKLEKALADAVAALEKADADNKAALEAMIADTKAALETALADAVAKLEKADADNKAALEKMIDQLEAALRAVTDALDARVTQNEEDIAQLRSALEQAIEDLKKAIAEGDEANAKALAEAVELLTKALEDAVSRLEEADEKNRAELEALIAEAKATLEMAIARLRNELYVVRAELLTIMGEHDAVLDGKITELAAALEAAIAASQAADEALGVRIDETVAALNAAIAEAKAVLNAAIEQVAADLESARQLLNLSIANGDKALHDRIDDLTAALNAAVAAADAADEALRTELNARIDDAVSTLNAAIAQVQKNLDEAVAAMDAKNAAQDQTITIVLVIAIVGVAGCVALLVVFIIDKRKVK